MRFEKNKECIKYFLMALVILGCMYTGGISKIFAPLYDRVYYGTITDMLLGYTSAIFYIIEIVILVKICKKIGVQVFAPKEEKGKELANWQVATLFALTIIPILIVSACINWEVKFVHDLGDNVTILGLWYNVGGMVSYGTRLMMMIMFIACIQRGFEFILKTNFIIPYGAIFAIITFGLIDFFVFSTTFRVFYLIISFLYGIIYLIAQRKVSITWVLCYIIYLL